MNIALTPRHRKLIERKVRSGSHGSAAEVVREGLRLLEEHDDRQRRLANLQAEVEQGFAGASSRWSERDASRVRRLIAKRIKSKA